MARLRVSKGGNATLLAMGPFHARGLYMYAFKSYFREQHASSMQHATFIAHLLQSSLLRIVVGYEFQKCNVMNMSRAKEKNEKKHKINKLINSSR